MDDTRSASEHVTHEKAVVEKNIKAQEVQLQALHKKIEENVSVLGDYESQNKRMTAENSILFTKLEEILGNASMLQKVKNQLQSQLDDAKRYQQFSFFRLFHERRKVNLDYRETHFQNYHIFFLIHQNVPHIMSFLLSYMMVS